MRVFTIPAHSPQIYASQRAILTFNLRAIKRARQLHRRDPFTLIHGHGDLVDGLIQGLLARRLKVPYILTVHGAVSQSWKYPLLMRAARPFLTRVIGVAELITDGLARAGYPTGHLAAISSGINTDQFYRVEGERRAEIRRRWNLDPNAVLFLSVGRLAPMKGYQGLLPAYLSAATLAGTQLAIAGDGPERQVLEQLVAGKEKHVRLLGNCSHSEVKELLAVADAFVLSSVRLHGTGEGTPTAVMEAMGAGLPILATLTGGVPQLGLDPATLVPEEDWGALVLAMEHAAHDGAWRRRTGMENRRLVQDRDWSRIAERVMFVYQAALSSQKGGPQHQPRQDLSDEIAKGEP